MTREDNRAIVESAIMTAAFVASSCDEGDLALILAAVGAAHVGGHMDELMRVVSDFSGRMLERKKGRAR